uniref:SJCHGC01726 protein n=1 Tax=Schistosoma japonicum TaxID=6182 RepID=Q5DBR4_SCHJA|nr:SJCHGC01726 protein [Schistosoma japonicum]
MNIHVFPKILFPHNNHCRPSPTLLSQTSTMTTEPHQKEEITIENLDKTHLDTSKEDDTLFELSKVSDGEIGSKDKLQSSLSQNSIDTQPINDYDKLQDGTNTADNTSVPDSKLKTSVGPLKKIIRSSITETEEVKEKSVKSYFDTVSSAGYPTSPPDFRIMLKHV